MHPGQSGQYILLCYELIDMCERCWRRKAKRRAAISDLLQQLQAQRQMQHVISKRLLPLQGDGTVSYDDPYSAASAVEWFNGKEFQGAFDQILHAIEACLKGAWGCRLCMQS